MWWADKIAPDVGLSVQIAARSSDHQMTLAKPSESSEGEGTTRVCTSFVEELSHAVSAQ